MTPSKTGDVVINMPVPPPTVLVAPPPKQYHAVRPEDVHRSSGSGDPIRKTFCVCLGILRTIILPLAILIILIALVYFAVFPILTPSLSIVPSASSITSNSSLTSSFEFEVGLSVDNPNGRKIAVNYDFIGAEISYHGGWIGSAAFSDFYQEKHESSLLTASFHVAAAPKPITTAKMQSEILETGGLTLDVKLVWRSAFKTMFWKREERFKAECKNVRLPSGDLTGFVPTSGSRLNTPHDCTVIID